MEYTPIPGFYNLLDYKLPKKVFKKLYEMQELLKHVSDNREYYYNFDRIGLRKAQELSARYQQIISNYEKKKFRKKQKR